MILDGTILDGTDSRRIMLLDERLGLVLRLFYAGLTTKEKIRCDSRERYP